MVITASRAIREGVGDTTLHVIEFASNAVDDGETYVSGLSGIIGWWFSPTDATSAQLGVDVSESSGTFTFHTGEDNRTGKLCIITSQPE